MQKMLYCVGCYPLKRNAIFVLVVNIDPSIIEQHEIYIDLIKLSDVPSVVHNDLIKRGQCILIQQGHANKIGFPMCRSCLANTIIMPIYSVLTVIRDENRDIVLDNNGYPTCIDINTTVIVDRPGEFNSIRLPYEKSSDMVLHAHITDNLAGSIFRVISYFNPDIDAESLPIADK